MTQTQTPVIDNEVQFYVLLNSEDAIERHAADLALFQACCKKQQIDRMGKQYQNVLTFLFIGEFPNLKKFCNFSLFTRVLYSTTTAIPIFEVCRYKTGSNIAIDNFEDMKTQCSRFPRVARRNCRVSFTKCIISPTIASNKRGYIRVVIRKLFT